MMYTLLREDLTALMNEYMYMPTAESLFELPARDSELRTWRRIIALCVPPI